MLQLYALKQSRAYRIAWLLELLEQKYQLHLLARDSKTFLAPSTLKTIHPLGKSPVLQDGEITIAESGAIVEYLLTHYDPHHRFKPQPDSPLWKDYQFWMHYAEGSLMPLLLISFIFNRIDNQKIIFFLKPIVKKITQQVRISFIQPQLELHLNYIENYLKDKKWLLGEKLSGADIMMSFPLQSIIQHSKADYPHIATYVTQIENDPTYQKVEAKMGKFSL